MGHSFVDAVKQRYILGHKRVLTALEDLTEDQMQWRPTTTAHSVVWNAWHLARWADYLQARIPTMTQRLQRTLGLRQEIWHAEDLARKWGLDAATLGWGEMGTDMDDGAAAALRFPEKEIVVGYLLRAYDVAERAVENIVEDEFGVVTSGIGPWESERGIGIYVVGLHAHDERHLGQIVYLRRLMGLPWKLERPGWTSA